MSARSLPWLLAVVLAGLALTLPPIAQPLWYHDFADRRANLRAMEQASGVTAEDIVVSWLPLYHDMGLIGACMGSLALGFHLVLMSPLAFLARPQRWLQVLRLAWAGIEARAALSRTDSPVLGILVVSLQDTSPAT